MPNPKDGNNFFRRVAKFVSNPVTQWGETLDAPAQASRENDAARSEIKEMIERKRRNDFVRKRELDLLRKLRREGLSSEQLASLGRSAEIADSDIVDEPPVKPVLHVKSKIDAIEQQISAEARIRPPTTTRQVDGDRPTVPMALNTRQGAAWVDTSAGGTRSSHGSAALAPPRTRAGVPLATALSREASGSGAASVGAVFGSASGVEVHEARHDPELDAAVIAFANADFAACEEALQTLIADDKARGDGAAIWLVLFDFYRAIGQEAAFESLAADFGARFGTPAPRWRSIPQALGEAQRGRPRVHWHVPRVLEAGSLARLPSRCEQWSLPWIVDWRELEEIEPAVMPALAALLGRWSKRRIDMRWLGGEHLLAILAEASPAGDAAGDRTCWEARLTVLRMLQLVERFDDAAIDYAATFGTAAPGWERALCRLRFIDTLGVAEAGSTFEETTPAFVETTLLQEPGQGSVAEVELSGELVGDIGPLLQRIDDQVADAETIVISCLLLVRVDFLASGDLLNWVIAKHREQRRLSFVNAQRLVAMFFAAMGIDEYARVAVDEG